MGQAMLSRARFSYFPTNRPISIDRLNMDAENPMSAPHSSNNRTWNQRKLQKSEMSHNYLEPAVRQSFCSVLSRNRLPMCRTKDVKSLSQPHPSLREAATACIYHAWVSILHDHDPCFHELLYKRYFVLSVPSSIPANDVDSTGGTAMGQGRGCS